MKPTNSDMDYRRGMERVRAIIAEEELGWIYGEIRTKLILWTTNHSEFQRHFGQSIIASVEKIIYGDVGTILRSIADAMRSTKS